MPSESPIVLNNQTELKIGFPPPLLGEEPVRLPAAPVGEGLLAVALPGGLLSEAHPLYPDSPSVIAGLQRQLQVGKPELAKLGMQIALSVNFIEPEVSGLLLVGLNRAGVEQWRNAFGSMQLTFTYELIAATNPEQLDEIVCELPVARHKQKPLMLISNKTGKKSRTVFQRVAVRGAYTLWRATTNLPRVHQIRLHAMECGFAVPGEWLYSKHAPLTWSMLEGKASKDGERAITSRPLVHLARIEGGERFPPIVATLEGQEGRLWAEFTAGGDETA